VQDLSPLARLGKKLFFDPSLSASGTQSCASCHSPAHAFGPPNDQAVQLGGPGLNLQGLRAVPSLRYASDIPPFSIGPDATDDAADTGHGRGGARAGMLAAPGPRTAKVANAGAEALVPQGGLFWDGRASNLSAQALGPLLNPAEMANVSPDAVAEKLRSSGYANDFKQAGGPLILEDKRRLLAFALRAIGQYQIEDAAFHPYDSKYDRYLRGGARLSAAERRGLALYEDPRKGNCAACHPDRNRADGRPPAFTDYQFEALGVPRNKTISVNADPAFFDLGLCGPSRMDRYAQQPQNCGLFRTPSLRNVAARPVFFHNGSMRTLREVLQFYVERDTDPGKFFPRAADGHVIKFDDLPAKYLTNIDTVDAPFDRKPGQTPALNDAEIGDIIAFLQTLNDRDAPVRRAGMTRNKN
jgi:cytochrome c peroxidase